MSPLRVMKTPASIIVVAVCRSPLQFMTDRDFMFDQEEIGASFVAQSLEGSAFSIDRPEKLWLDKPIIKREPLLYRGEGDTCSQYTEGNTGGKTIYSLQR